MNIPYYPQIYIQENIGDVSLSLRTIIRKKKGKQWRDIEIAKRFYKPVAEKWSEIHRFHQECYVYSMRIIIPKLGEVEDMFGNEAYPLSATQIDEKERLEIEFKLP